MSKDKRYTLDLSGHIYAHNDREAMLISARIKELIESEIESIQNLKVTELTKTPFASFDFTTVHKGDISIFENKILLQ